ncbi:hypothetical protein JTE90_025009 [Oedothorax gibbosus]|uniref:CCDC92/74 N-terminal domain-containing protein n=1 Tax=Oedothorax gibbosus TaxID=931172 RepID=A0AAV6VTG8_9ARAC|nr:hypothetical protein JTE90_025009 [Oedothorax gibbosus]
MEELKKTEISSESASSNDENDIGHLKEQLRVAQDSIKFLQKEHADMLEGLHTEIQQLQDMCRDLQFRCEVEGCLMPDDEFFKCSPAMLEQKVKDLLQENADLKHKLAESHQAIDILDQKEKLALWQHHQELEQRDTAILKLEKELESRSAALHQISAASSQRKARKSSFWRRFSFAQSGSAQQTPSGPSTSSVDRLPRVLDHLSREDLPSEIQNSLQSLESQHQSCSSYSSLSDKSVSDDEGFGQHCDKTLEKASAKRPSVSEQLAKLEHVSVSGKIAFCKYRPDFLGCDGGARKHVR